MSPSGSGDSAAREGAHRCLKVEPCQTARRLSTKQRRATRELIEEVRGWRSFGPVPRQGRSRLPEGPSARGPEPRMRPDLSRDIAADAGKEPTLRGYQPRVRRLRGRLAEVHHSPDQLLTASVEETPAGIEDRRPAERPVETENLNGQPVFHGPGRAPREDGHRVRGNHGGQILGEHPRHTIAERLGPVVLAGEPDLVATRTHHDG